MREIKFRAWRFGTRVLSRVQRLEVDNGRVVGALLYDTADKEFSLPIDDFILMQYTGLKDKNRVEIYEGDIVKDNWFLNMKIAVDELWVAHKLIDIDKMNDPMKYVEVIGNIHENPELVKEAKGIK